MWDTDKTIEELKFEIKRLEGNRILDSDVTELQQLYAEISKIYAGKRMRCVIARDDIMLKVGQEFDFVSMEAGIFSTPYMTVKRDDGKTMTGHDYRWEMILEDGSTERIIPRKWG